MSDKVALGVGVGVGVPGSVATIVGAVFTYLAWKRKSRRQEERQRAAEDTGERIDGLERSAPSTQVSEVVSEGKLGGTLRPVQ